jgi:hypothetical protein
MIRPKAIVSFVTAALVLLASCGSSGQAPLFPLENDTKNASKQQVGERLFVETRFAEYFAAHMNGVNDPLVAGDPVVAQVLTTGGTLLVRSRENRSTAAPAILWWSCVAFLASLTEDYDDA